MAYAISKFTKVGLLLLQEIGKYIRKFRDSSGSEYHERKYPNQHKLKRNINYDF